MCRGKKETVEKGILAVTQKFQESQNNICDMKLNASQMLFFCWLYNAKLNIHWGEKNFNNVALLEK